MAVHHQPVRTLVRPGRQQRRIKCRSCRTVDGDGWTEGIGRDAEARGVDMIGKRCCALTRPQTHLTRTMGLQLLSGKEAGREGTRRNLHFSGRVWTCSSGMVGCRTPKGWGVSDAAGTHIQTASSGIVLALASEVRASPHDTHAKKRFTLVDLLQLCKFGLEMGRAGEDDRVFDPIKPAF